eukprot:1084405-Pelagomonas_calceolata.AAC.1
MGNVSALQRSQNGLWWGCRQGCQIGETPGQAPCPDLRLRGDGAVLQAIDDGHAAILHTGSFAATTTTTTTTTTTAAVAIATASNAAAVCAAGPEVICAFPNAGAAAIRRCALGAVGAGVRGAGGPGAGSDPAHAQQQRVELHHRRQFPFSRCWSLLLAAPQP